MRIQYGKGHLGLQDLIGVGYVEVQYFQIIDSCIRKMCAIWLRHIKEEACKSRIDSMLHAERKIIQIQDEQSRHFRFAKVCA